MKIGDLVKRHDGRIGVVVSVGDFLIPESLSESIDTREWAHSMGRKIIVMWQGGEKIESLPEKSLETVDENR